MPVAVSLLLEPWISRPGRWYCQEFLGVRGVLCCEGHGCSEAMSPGLVSAEQKLGPQFVQSRDQDWSICTVPWAVGWLAGCVLPF